MADLLNLNPLRIFVAVVDHGGFSSAARSLGIAKTLASRQVAGLEASIGTNLLVRTTRRVVPTEAGRTLYDRARVLLAAVQDTYTAVADAKSEPSGCLTLTAPHEYATTAVVPALVQFMQQNPGCACRLISSDQKLDLADGNLDLAIRVGWLSDSTNQARRIGTFRQIAVASPDLVERFTDVDCPAELADRPSISIATLPNANCWAFRRADQMVEVEVHPRIAVDTTQAAREAALLGAGFAVLPDFLVSEDIRQGLLVELAKGWQLQEGGVFVVYPPGRFRPSRVSAFVALLIEHHRRIVSQKQWSPDLPRMEAGLDLQATPTSIAGTMRQESPLGCTPAHEDCRNK